MSMLDHNQKLYIMSSLARRGQIPGDDRPSESWKKPKLQKGKEDFHSGKPVMVKDPQSKIWDEGIKTNVRVESQS